MRNKKHYPIIFNLLSIVTGRCLAINKYDSILSLKNPKLFLDGWIDSSIDDVVVDVNHVNNLSIYHSKNDKKSKTSFNSSNIIDNKQNNLRQKKKLKIKMQVNKRFDDISDDLTGFKHLEPVRVLKNIKNLKVKKNIKSKVDIVNDYQLASDTKVNAGSLKTIYLNNLLTIKELSNILNVPSVDIIKWLFLQGVSVTINQILDTSTCTLIAKQYGFTVLKKHEQLDTMFQVKQKNSYGKLRAPVVTILGHVDHGKTTLLQAMKAGNKLKPEFGNITQEIGAYEIDLNSNHVINKLIFIDTPGHEAFVGMRTTGIDITDIAILVVSADDGLKSQTIEAIENLQLRKVPFIIVINKIDKDTANIDQVKNQLTKYGILDDKLSNNYQIIPVSALTGKNIPFLLLNLLEFSRKKRLKSDLSQLAEGTIIEAYLDKQRGVVVHLLVQNGTLKKGDIVVAGNTFGKIKAISNSLNDQVSTIESVSLAKLLCFSSIPSTGITFKVVKNEEQARYLVSTYSNTNSSSLSMLNKRLSLDYVSQKSNKTFLKRVNFIIKTNTQGSIDAIITSLLKIPQDKVQINLLSVASGLVSLKDIQLASTSNSTILAFNINVSAHIVNTAEKINITIRKFKIIYDLLDYVKSHMLSFVEQDYEKQIIGKAIVKNIFAINKGLVAGCLILDGKLKKNSYLNIKRKDKVIYNGNIDSLKRLKEDIDEVFVGNECGVMCRDYNMWQIDDLIESYELKPLGKFL